MWFLERWLESPKTVKKLVYVLYASLIISCLLGFAVQYWAPPEHVEFVWEQIPVFSAIYGFVGCAAIIILSKAFGHAGIMVEEDYYDK